MSSSFRFNWAIRSFVSTFVAGAVLLNSTVFAVSSPGNIEKRTAPPLPNGWNFLGCYTDSSNPRTVVAASYTGSNVSVETCTTFCSAYAYAGMEYSDECYCGDSLSSAAGTVIPSQCNMPCAGNAEEDCGGPWLLTVLQQLSVPTVSPPITVPSFQTWTSLGCYSDSVNSRTLPYQAAVSGVTVESCCLACQAAGFPLAGVEYSSQCFCGTLIENGGAAVTSGCNMACVGNSSELCGGSNRLNVYNNTAVSVITPTVGPWQSIGCYSDNVNARTLVNFMALSSPMTVELCIAACQASNFSFAGLEYSSQCFCGNAFVNGGAHVNSGCDMTCAGNPDEICGGPNRLSVYNNTANSNSGIAQPPTVVQQYNGWTSLGCYSDNVPAEGQRALNVGVGVNGPFTVENCLDTCHQFGFTLAGVESGNQCWCSSVTGLGSVPVSQGCNLPCQGNTSEVCGGTFSLNLYARNYQPPPITLPSYGTWQSTGCYSWSPGAPGFFGFGFNGLMTVEKCVSACQARNYPRAAVSNTGCNCANSYANSATPSNVGCIVPCFGNTSEFCGNEYYFNGYRNTAFGQVNGLPPTTVPGYGYWVSIGCYSNGALSIDFTSDITGPMTVEKCVSSCSAGLTIAGVENGNKCFCGDNLSNSATSVTSCSTVCTGNGSEFCGGPTSLNVYNYTLPFV